MAAAMPADLTAARSCPRGDAGSRELFDIACSQPTVSDKFHTHDYELMYGQFLMPLRGLPRPKLLEIGLGCNMNYGPGSSARLWRTLFPRADLWMADSNAACVAKHRATLDAQGISVLVGDQGNLTTLRRWLEISGGGFHAVIDDGSHVNSHILTTFRELWGAVLPGGHYFIEDLQLGRHAVWDDSGGLTVMSDVIASWVDQKLIPYQEGGFRNGNEGYWAAGNPKRFRKSAPNSAAVDAWRRHPLPPHVAYIFCQEAACVIGKSASAPLPSEPTARKPGANRCRASGALGGKAKSTRPN